MEIAAAKVLFELFGSTGSREKLAAMRPYLEDVRKHFAVSIEVTGETEDIERLEVGIAVVASEEKIARARLQKILAHIDATAPARMTYEDRTVFSMD